MNESEKNTHYQRIVAKDETFDGEFYTCVRSTGIYCLPSCTARKPKIENVLFVETEAQAKAAGFRACLRCKPDAFSTSPRWGAKNYAVFLQWLRENLESVPTLDSLSERANLSAAQLTELANLHAHLSPQALLQREQTQALCHSLLNSNVGVSDALGSLNLPNASHFRQVFLAAQGMTPETYCTLRDTDHFQLQLPALYRPAETLAYFARDVEQVAEKVTGQTIYKPFAVADEAAMLSIEFTANGQYANCQLHSERTLSPHARAYAHTMALRMLGLQNTADEFEARALQEQLVASVIGLRAGMRPTMTATPFEALVWAIVGQQVNLAFATTLRRTAIQCAGKKFPGSTLMLHPTPTELSELALATLTNAKFSTSKAKYLLNAALSVANGTLALDQLPEQSAVTAETALKSLHGVGPWSAAYVMLRGLGFGDCVPVGDSGLNEGLKRFFKLEQRPDASQTLELMSDFAPHRSMATFHLWASLKDAT